VVITTLALRGAHLLTADGLLREPYVVYGLLLTPFATLLVALLFLAAPKVVRWNILLLVLFAALTEVVFAAIAEPEPKVVSDPQGLNGKDYYVADARLGYRLVPDNVARHRKTVDGRTVYDVTYRIDPFGRRETPRPSAAAPDRFLLFFGGSNTFGEGLGQDETLPYHVTRAAPRFRAYNYGLHGYGLAQMLDLLQTRDLARELEEDRGAALYYFIPDHMARLVGASNVSPTWGRHFSQYVATPDGGLRYVGNFDDGRHWTTFAYALLARSNIVRHFGLVLPTSYDDADFKLAARTAVESVRRLQAQVALDRFAVVLSPATGERQRRITRRFAQALESLGIEYIDLSQTLDLNDPRNRVAADDYHQSGAANAVLAAHLAAWLKGLP
jgi:hypothetical protein